MEDLHTTIERYVDGELSGQELAEFEKRLESDSDLAAEVQLFQQAKASLSDQFVHEEAENNLKATLQEVSPSYFQEKKKQARIIPLLRRYGLPAAGIAAAVVLILIFQPFQGSLYDQYKQLPTASFIEQSASDLADLAAAQQAFNQKDYATALNIFQQYLNEEANRDDVEIRFYTGLCHLELDQLSPARSIFESLHAGNSVYQTEGTWYLAMTYLKEEDWERCVEYLRQIPEGTERWEEAQRLLSKL